MKILQGTKARNAPCNDDTSVQHLGNLFAVDSLWCNLAAMYQLLDFANHGILPFVGRQREIERIHAFVRSASEGSTLHAGIVIGEAGIGKSRLFDEVLPQCERFGSVVVRTKLHPGGVSSLVPLIAQSLWLAGDTRTLLRKEPEATPASVIVALQRLARLRPTMLVVEDIHLLNSDAVAEFAMIVGALADEPLSLLCSARPLELTARGIIEPFLVMELPLSGLDQQAISGMWKILFHHGEDPQLLERLHQKTFGNPLALRSAIRSAVKADSAQSSNEVHIRFDRNVFSASLDRNVRLLAEGMTAHLTAEERESAEMFALLGEVFSRSAARAVVPDADSMMAQLFFKGILTTPNSPVHVLTPTPDNEQPVAFTHTLLHNHLYQQKRFNPEGIQTILREARPLYSVLPFRRTLEFVDQLHGSEEEGLAMCNTLWGTLEHVDVTTDFRYTVDLNEVVCALTQNPNITWSPYMRHGLYCQTLLNRLMMLRRDIDSQEYRSILDDVLSRTESYERPGEAQLRLGAMSQLLKMETQHRVPEQERIAEIEVAKIVELHPPIIYDMHYIYHLSLRLEEEQDSRLFDRLRKSELEVKEILESQKCQEIVKQRLTTSISPYFTYLFDTPEELAQRRQRIGEMVEVFPPPQSWTASVMQLFLLAEIAETKQLLEAIQQHRQLYADLNIPEGSIITSVLSSYATIMSGCSAEESIERMVKEHQTIPPIVARSCTNMVSEVFISLGVYFGDFSIVESVAARTAITDNCIFYDLLPSWRYHRNGVEGLRQLNDEYGGPEVPLLTLLRLAIAANSESVTLALEILQKPMVRLMNVVWIRGVELIAREFIIPAFPEAQVQLNSAIASAAHRMAEWFAERRLFLPLEGMLKDFRNYFSAGDIEGFAKQAATLREKFLAEQAVAPAVLTGKIRLTMLGRVEILLPDGTRQPVRGGRMKSILGLFVADQMSRKPLTKQEFYLLAAGEEGKDFELARKTVNMAISTLRKSIGDDAFIRDEDSIRINFERVEIDLLQAWYALREAISALKHHSYSRARTAVVRALEIAAGEVPFPSLYDDYFEAVREDFETRLRDAVVEVSKALLREGDVLGAEEILQRGFEWLSEDEEIGQLLQQSLTTLNHRAEAERVKMKYEVL